MGRASNRSRAVTDNFGAVVGYRRGIPLARQADNFQRALASARLHLDGENELDLTELLAVLALAPPNSRAAAEQAHLREQLIPRLVEELSVSQAKLFRTYAHHASVVRRTTARIRAGRDNKLHLQNDANTVGVSRMAHCGQVITGTEEVARGVWAELSAEHCLDCAHHEQQYPECTEPRGYQPLPPASYERFQSRAHEEFAHDLSELLAVASVSEQDLRTAALEATHKSFLGVLAEEAAALPEERFRDLLSEREMRVMLEHAKANGRTDADGQVEFSKFLSATDFLEVFSSCVNSYPDGETRFNQHNVKGGLLARLRAALNS